MVHESGIQVPVLQTSADLIPKILIDLPYWRMRALVRNAGISYQDIRRAKLVGRFFESFGNGGLRSQVACCGEQTR
jgi:hypothetical protein